MNLQDDGHCFVCGKENLHGLRLVWQVEGHEAFSEFVPQKMHQGWKDVVHGGILATLLDEAMTRLIWVKTRAAVTAEMTVRYLAPAKVGEKLRVHGWIVNDSRRLIRAQADITKEDGTVVARAEGKALRVESPAPAGVTSQPQHKI